jgi:hypothetical protein
MGDRLKDKVALVSGAGSSGPGWGNGKATAVLFAREGAKVLAADINRDAALETKRIIDGEGGICEAVSADVSRADDVSAMVSAHIVAFGRIDVLHINVGIVEVGGPVETTEESWDRVILPPDSGGGCNLSHAADHCRAVDRPAAMLTCWQSRPAPRSRADVPRLGPETGHSGYFYARDGRSNRGTRLTALSALFRP